MNHHLIVFLALCFVSLSMATVNDHNDNYDSYESESDPPVNDYNNDVDYDAGDEDEDVSISYLNRSPALLTKRLSSQDYQDQEEESSADLDTEQE
jgi:hypothetical protein